MADQVIVTENLTKRYGELEALRALNMKVSRGVFGFLGPNAAGKTTTIKILMGLLKPTSGQAYVLGFDVLTESLKIRDRVGYLPENPTFYQHMSGEEFLDFIARLRDVPRGTREEQTRNLLDKVGLLERREDKIGNYSRGMVQRLAIAQALIGEPELLLFDEPTASLDPLGREDILSLIKDLRKDGASLFISSHILGEVERVCDHIAILNRGSLIAEGSLEDIKERLATVQYRLRVSKPEAVVKALSEKSYIKDAWVEKDEIIAIPSDEGEFKRSIPRVILESQAELTKLERVLPSLQEAFVSLVRREEGEVPSHRE